MGIGEFVSAALAVCFAATCNAYGGPIDLISSACVQHNLDVVDELVNGLAEVSQMRGLDELVLSGKSTPLRFEDAFKCVTTIVATSTTTAESECTFKPRSFWETAIHASTKLTQINGTVSPNSNRYSISIPIETISDETLGHIVNKCVRDLLHAPQDVIKSIPTGTSPELRYRLNLAIGVSWPSIESTLDSTPNARVYFTDDGEYDHLQSFEWPLLQSMAASSAPTKLLDYRVRTYTKSRDCLDIDDFANPLIQSKELPPALFCWLVHRPNHSDNYKTDLLFPSPVPFKFVKPAFTIPTDLLTPKSRIGHLNNAKITHIAVSGSSVTFYHHLIPPTIASVSIPNSSHTSSSLSYSLSRCELKNTLQNMPQYPLPASTKSTTEAPFSQMMNTSRFFGDVYQRNVSIWQLDETSSFGLDPATLKHLLSEYYPHAGDSRYISLKHDEVEVDVLAKLSTADELWNDLNREDSLAPNSSFTPDINFRAGVSVILKGVHEAVHPSASPLKALKQHVEDIVQLPVGINMYISSPNGVALPPHTDPYDVMVIGIAGIKEWQICETPTSSVHIRRCGATKTQHFTVADAAEADEISRKNPSGCSVFADEIARSDLRCTSIEIRSGDVLYIPKGVVHNAKALTSMTAHVTLSLNRKGFTWADGFLASLKGADAAATKEIVHMISSTTVAGVALNRPYPTHIASDVHNAAIEHHFDQLQSLLRGVLLTVHQQERKWFPETVKSLSSVSLLELNTFIMDTLHLKLVATSASRSNDMDKSSVEGSQCSLGFEPTSVSRTRRGSCAVGATFSCPSGSTTSTKPYIYSTPSSCDSCVCTRKDCGWHNWSYRCWCAASSCSSGKCPLSGLGRRREGEVEGIVKFTCTAQESAHNAQKHKLML